MIKSKEIISTPKKIKPVKNNYQLWIIFIVIALDQALKWLVRSQHLFWVLNRGSAFSFGANWWWFEWIVWGTFAALLVSGIGYQVLSMKNYKLQITNYKQIPNTKYLILNTISWALLIGGGASNLIDRLLWGGVVDYIKIGPPAGGLPVFNLADVAINVGVGLLILSRREFVYDGYMWWFKLTKTKRDLLAEKFMDTGNLAMAGLVFGLVATGTINSLLIISGVALYLLFMFLGYIIKK